MQGNGDTPPAIFHLSVQYHPCCPDLSLDFAHPVSYTGAMREEIRNWWEQARADYVTAQELIPIRRFYASVFFSQQAAEKALKALWLHLKRTPALTHNLVEMAEGLQAPEQVLQACIELNPDYVVTRYPDAANGVPEQMYTEESAREHLGYGERVMTWVKSLLPL